VYEYVSSDPDPDPPFLPRPLRVGARVTMRAPLAGLDTFLADGAALRVRLMDGAALRDATAGLFDGAALGDATAGLLDGAALDKASLSVL
jgi:hypothetical protein